MRHVTPRADCERNGGPWCPRCQAWTEVDVDREMNVCLRCGRPGVEMKPPVWAHRQRVQLNGKRLSPEEAHRLFDVIRAAIR